MQRQEIRNLFEYNDWANDRLVHMMRHVAMHSMYHRGQITARLIDLGKEAAVESTDLLAFYLEPHSRRP